MSLADPSLAPAAAPGKAVPAQVPRDPLPGLTHREAYAATFARLAAHPDAAAAQRRLVPHLDAALEPADRLALWQALWQVHQRLSPAQRSQMAARLDGRFAERLSWLDQPWGAPAMVEALARLGASPAGRPRWVPVWLAHHGLRPLDEPAAHHPALVMLAARAALEGAAARLAPATIESLQAAVLDAAGRDTALLPQGLALLFELSLQARDEATATAALAELLHHGHAAMLRAERVGDWLDGCAMAADEALPQPLRLAATWQPRWLQPARWALPAVRQALHAALRRDGPRQRLAQLSAQLDALAAELGAPTSAPARAATVDAQALRVLQALDAAWALAERGGNACAALGPLLDPTTLAAPTLSALHHSRAASCAAQGDFEGQALALLLARRHRADERLHRELAAVLQTLGAVPSARFDADGLAEAPFWQGLLASGTPPLQRLARLALARLHTDGQLEPQAPRRQVDWDAAQAHWTALEATNGEHPYRGLAHAALQSAPLRHLHPLQSRLGGRDHLWVECPGAQGVLIVPACVASHHTYPEVAALQGRLPGRHLLFVNNPEKNWYCDDAFDAVCAVVRARVLDRFAPQQVSCWYGSMGGHGAIKLALHFGFKAMAFNPQVDLDLWAAFRPAERALLWGSTRHRSLLDAPAAAWARTPLYLAVGSDTPDREALSMLIDRWRSLPELSLVVEKFDDPHHAGLMTRISGGPVAPVLARIDQRLTALAGAAPLPGMRALDRKVAPGFWQALDDEAACAVEVQVRGGRLWWQPSAACGTLKNGR